VTRETLLVPWRDLLRVYRRLEARGEVRGGRFVGGFSGEQYALPEAVGLLRAVRRQETSGALVTVSGADPLNLVGIITPGDALPALATNRVLYRDGIPVAVKEGEGRGRSSWPKSGRRNSVAPDCPSAGPRGAAGENVPRQDASGPVGGSCRSHPQLLGGERGTGDASANLLEGRFARRRGVVAERSKAAVVGRPQLVQGDVFGGFQDAVPHCFRCLDSRIDRIDHADEDALVGLDVVPQDS